MNFIYCIDFILFISVTRTYVTGTYMVSLGHGRVYGYVDTGSRALHRSCLRHRYI